MLRLAEMIADRSRRLSLSSDRSEAAQQASHFELMSESRELLVKLYDELPRPGLVEVTRNKPGPARR